MSDAIDDTTSQEEIYTPPSILKRETDTIWEWRGDEDGNGEYVDTGRTPTASERFMFAIEPTDTPLLNMIKGRS